MSFPGTYREIREITLRTALHTQMARAIARKAGLRSVAGGQGEAFSRTLLDAWVVPRASKENWQWDVDLSGYTHIRFVNRSTRTLYLYYSLAGFGSTALDPGDYLKFPSVSPDDFYPFDHLEAFSANSEMDGGNPWSVISDPQRVPMRLSISTLFAHWDWETAGPGWSLVDQGRGFSLGVQVR